MKRILRLIFFTMIATVSLSFTNVQPTYTPAPTYTPLPTLPSMTQYITVTPYLQPTALIPALMDQEFQCGDWRFMLTFMKPKIQATLTEHFPVGKFLMMRIKVSNQSAKAENPLQNESFQVNGSLYGRDVTIWLDRPNTDYANKRWDMPSINQKIGTIPLETFLIFDINPEMVNYALIFKPMPEGSTEPQCKLTIPLPIVLW